MRYNSVTRHGKQCPCCLEVKDNEDFLTAPSKIGRSAHAHICESCQKEADWFERFHKGIDCVYLIESGGRWKIGYTSDLSRRIPALRNMSPVAVHLVHVWSGSRQHETVAHKQLRKHRHHGEWFELSPEIIQNLRENPLRDPMLSWDGQIIGNKKHQ